MAEDIDQSLAEAEELLCREATRLAARTDAGTKEGLVSVDVADTMEQRLVEQRGLNGSLALVEEGDEIFGRRPCTSVRR